MISNPQAALFYCGRSDKQNPSVPGRYCGLSGCRLERRKGASLGSIGPARFFVRKPRTVSFEFMRRIQRTTSSPPRRESDELLKLTMDFETVSYARAKDRESLFGNSIQCHSVQFLVRPTVREVLMKKTLLIIPLVCIALAIVIFVFAEGARAVYSGSFFAMLAVVVFVTWWVRFRHRP